MQALPDLESNPMAQPLSVSDANLIQDQEDLAQIEPNANKQNVNTQALNGLRGFLSIYIMLFHTLLFSKWQFNILGSVPMTFFFLLSGFVLGLNEGKRQYLPTICCTELTKRGDGHYDARNFYQRRIARTLPLYYVTNIMCIPLIRAGHAYVDPGIGEYIVYVLTLFGTTTWLGIPVVLNGPSWFVSTIWFFYWMFPSLLPQFQRYSVKETRRWIVIHHIIQFIGGCVLFGGFAMIVPELAFYIGTFWPPSRLPVFIMGVLAGLLRSQGLSLRERQSAWTVADWRRRSDVLAIAFVLSFIGVMIVENYPDKEWELMSAVWMQLGIAWWALQFIVALTFDEGTSISARMLTSKVALFCGRFSYAIYLLHVPVIQYVCWMHNGVISKPNCESREFDEIEGVEGFEGEYPDHDTRCKAAWEAWNGNRLIPVWCIPAVLLVSMVAGTMLTKVVEEPCRKQLRPRRTDNADLGDIAMHDLECAQNAEIVGNGLA